MKTNKWEMICCVALILLAGLALLVACRGTTEAASAMTLNVSFQGEYKIGDGQWQPIVKGKHIPATKGDVTLRGFFQCELQNGEVIGPVEQGGQIAIYFNHIGGEIYLNGVLEHSFDAENPLLGKSACGKQWIVYEYTGTEEDALEIVLKSPHVFGNETAVDDFLGMMCIYVSGAFENQAQKTSSAARFLGAVVIITALSLFGVALFSSLMGLQQSRIMWLVGITLFFAGGYIFLDGPGSEIRSAVTFRNQGTLLCMMLYTFFLERVSVEALTEHTRRIGGTAINLSGVVTGVLIASSMMKQVRLFDTLLLWTVAQGVAILVLLVCYILDLRHVRRGQFALLTCFAVALLALLMDALGTGLGWWQGEELSKYVFVLLYLVVLVIVLRIIPMNIRESIQAKTLQAEMEKSKTAIMLSQIQPHFLYNSLSAIRELCRQDPDEAREALCLFTTYLRGNMDSLKSEHPVHFSKELSHIETYLKLEKMRFGDDLKIVYDIQEDDFFLPSLTVQPLVENAVKHGVCSREDGGTVTLHTHREKGKIFITITDDGVGFDTTEEIGPQHVGIWNVQNRLRSMSRGTLQIESTPAVGTVVTITLPVQEGESK